MARKAPPPNQENLPAEVIPIHQNEPPPPAPVEEAPRFRWFVPSAPPPYYAHAIVAERVTDETRTVCRGHRAVGGVAPPMPGIPRCPECEVEIARRTAAAPSPSSDESPPESGPTGGITVG